MNLNYTEVISLPCGKIKGEVVAGTVAAFKGIPYAAPPVGELRFKAPKPYGKWEGTLDCSSFGKSAMQNPPGSSGALWTEEFLISNRTQSEDCLTLNVWTDLNDCGKKPVIFYLYGGGLVSGGSSCEIYDGKTLAESGVVYVTSNRREGNLGLISDRKLAASDPEGYCGNWILLDILAALRWVKENIAALGGDPENITMMGQSSGSICLNALAASPMTKGLFRRFISMSYNNYVDREFGSTSLPLETGFENTEKILQEHGWTSDDLMTLESEAFAGDPKLKNLIIDGKVVESDFRDGVDSGLTNDKEAVMGMVPGDYLVQSPFASFVLQGIKSPSQADLLSAMKSFLQTEELYDEFCMLYSSSFADANYLKKNLEEDFLISSLLYYAEGRKKAGAEYPTRLYYFTHVLPGPMSSVFGAFHSSELPYFFNHFADFRKEYWREEDFALGRYLCRDLAKLVRDDEESDLEKTPDDGYSYFRIGSSGGEICRFDEAKRSLWFAGFDHMTH